jgi:hypothetical protein
LHVFSRQGEESIFEWVCLSAHFLKLCRPPPPLNDHRAALLASSHWQAMECVRIGNVTVNKGRRGEEWGSSLRFFEKRAKFEIL